MTTRVDGKTYPDGSIQVRLIKSNGEPHIFMLTPGCDVEGTLSAVNAQLITLNCGIMDASIMDGIRADVFTTHKAATKAAYNTKHNNAVKEINARLKVEEAK